MVESNDVCSICGKKLLYTRYYTYDTYTYLNTTTYTSFCDECFFKQYVKEYEDSKKVIIRCSKCNKDLSFKETSYNKYAADPCDCSNQEEKQQ